MKRMNKKDRKFYRRWTYVSLALMAAGILCFIFYSMALASTTGSAASLRPELLKPAGYILIVGGVISLFSEWIAQIRYQA